MSYRLETHETLPEGIKRIALEQIDKALQQLTDVAADPDETVHDARKRFKKIRAVLRLVRDEIGEDVYKSENIFYRDAGRKIGAVRDAVVVIDTLDDLHEHYGDQLAPDAFDALREKLVDRHTAIKERILDDQKAREAIAITLREARTRVDDWPIEHNDFSAIHDGLKRVYKRGYRGFQNAYDDPTPANFHEWRKRAKYLWYHTRILKPLWPNVLSELADAIHDLSDSLGDDHDLVTLHATLSEQPDLIEDHTASDALIALIEQRRAELESSARPLGQRIYAEKPGILMDRIESYWDAWQPERTHDQ